MSEAKQAWAAGLSVFAGIVMIILGGFQVLYGFAAIVKEQFFVATPNYLYAFNVKTWGWIQLLVGIAVIVAGTFVLLGATLARWVAILVTGVSTIGNFMAIPHYPFWGIVLVAVDVAVIWALAAWQPEPIS